MPERYTRGARIYLGITQNTFISGQNLVGLSNNRLSSQVADGSTRQRQLADI